MCDKDILEIFYKNGILNASKCSKKFLENNKEIKNYLDNRYKEPFKYYSEVLYRIKNKIEEWPKCEICGSPLKNIYSKYCCKSCAAVGGKKPGKEKRLQELQNQEALKPENQKEITDKMILDIFVINTGKRLLINGKKACKKWLKAHLYVKEYLETRYKDVNIKHLLKTNKINYVWVIKRILNRVEYLPSCPTCGKIILNFNHQFCSRKCQRSNKELNKRRTEASTKTKQDNIKSDPHYYDNAHIKCRETYKKNTGYDHPMKNPKVLKKSNKQRIKSLRKHYNMSNITSPGQIPEVIQKAQDTMDRKGNRNSHQGIAYIYKEIRFDSSWELSFYIWAEDFQKNVIRNTTKYFTYTEKGKLHRYYPDFLWNDKIIEIKGDRYFKNNHLWNPFNKTFQLEKEQCMIDNHVILWKYVECKKYIDYINKNYSKGYLKQFRYKRKSKNEKSSRKMS